MTTPGIQTILAPAGTEMFTSIDAGGPGYAQMSLQVASSFWRPNASVTAGTTQTLTGATQLILGVNVVSVVGTTGDGVKLPVLNPGQYAIVFNTSGTNCSVYPGNSSGNIDAAGAGVAVTLTAAKRCIYFCTAANTIISAQLGVVSA